VLWCRNDTHHLHSQPTSQSPLPGPSLTARKAGKWGRGPGQSKGTKLSTGPLSDIPVLEETAEWEAGYQDQTQILLFVGCVTLEHYWVSLSFTLLYKLGIKEGSLAHEVVWKINQLILCPAQERHLV
jgi:hypothetical protein